MAKFIIAKLAAIQLDATNKKPPEEFRLFAFGSLETTQGTFLFDKAAAEAVMAEYKDNGNELSFDYEHAAVQDPPPPTGAPAAGWFGLELRDDGLYAVNIKWTERAIEYLSNSEYRYFSPAFKAEGKSKRIMKLFNVALTNIPASKDQEPLVAASARPRDLRVTKLAAMSFDQIRAALQEALRRMLVADGLYGWVCDVYDDSVVYCVGDDLFQAPYLVEGADAVIGEPIEVQRTYTPVVDDDDEEEMTTMKNLLKQLKLDEKATEADALVALAGLQKTAEESAGLTRFQSELFKLLGTTTIGESVGTVSALKAKADGFDAAQAELTKLKTEHATREVEQLVADGSRDGKIPPAMKDFWLEQGKKDITALRTYLEKAPKLVANEGKTPSKLEPGTVTVVSLSDDEKQIAKTMGISEKDFLATKQKHAERATSVA